MTDPQLPSRREIDPLMIEKLDNLAKLMGLSFEGVNAILGRIEKDVANNNEVLRGDGQPGLIQRTGILENCVTKLEGAAADTRITRLENTVAGLVKAAWIIAAAVTGLVIEAILGGLK